MYKSLANVNMLRLQGETFKFTARLTMVNGGTDRCTVVIIVYCLPVTHDNNNSNNSLNYVWLVHYFTVFNIHICYRLKIKNINLKIDERVKNFTS
jgi:hypothetical protein